MFSVGFDELERLLADADAEVAAAEAHGCLAGALCSAARYRLDQWIEEILPDEQIPRLEPATQGAFEAVFLETAQAMAGQDMAFQPLLPDDEATLARRVAGLAQWCHGFLYGLALGSTVAFERMPGEVGEVLRDFSAISRAEVEAGEPGESDEAAYADLVEFVRAGTQLVFEELADARRAVAPADQRLH
jgi:uncharacterized protein YgfB (UPF0149 family)